jgi:3-dehydroquinate synthase
MKSIQYKFSNKTTNCYFDADFSYLENLVDKNHSIIITDENVFSLHPKKFKGWQTIVIKPGESSKIQATVDFLVEQLVRMEADRKTFLIGAGGGVVTDITGFVASIYMRGVRFGFVPSTLLAMVDASVGGKNGIDIGPYKNLVGLIRQPDFLLFDISLLKSLPKEEWANGFAEIIKHASIKSVRLFRELEQNKPGFYQKDKAALSKLIRTNVKIKSEIIQKDEFESGERRVLNFGHTLGHAIERLYGLSHGRAISIGMIAAALLSEQFTVFKDTTRLAGVLQKFGLPTSSDFDSKKVFRVLRMDKKKVNRSMNYVLLKKIGQAQVKNIPMDQLEKLIESIASSR